MKYPMFDKAAQTAGQGKLALFFLVPFTVVLAALIAFFVIREQRLADEARFSELKEAAQAFYEQIADARIWNAGHGGVYAEITETTRPNPYLQIPDRDIKTIDGRRFTRINPAYMTRQLSDIARERHGTRFRIIGFRPLNPSNAPNGWEEAALSSLAVRGNHETEWRFEKEAGKDFFTYLVPLFIEKPCLACHGRQGFQAGDVKGAIVINIPTDRFDAARSRNLKKTVLSLSAVGLAGLMCTVLMTAFLCRRLAGEIRANIVQGKKVAAMELAGAAAHELRQPLTVIMCLKNILEEKLSKGETVSEGDMQVLNSQCLRMNDIIERLMHVMNYRTKEYAQGINILDLEACSAGDREGGVQTGSLERKTKEQI